MFLSLGGCYFAQSGKVDAPIGTHLNVLNEDVIAFGNIGTVAVSQLRLNQNRVLCCFGFNGGANGFSGTVCQKHFIRFDVHEFSQIFFEGDDLCEGIARAVHSSFGDGFFGFFAHAQRVFVKAQQHGFLSRGFDKLRLSSDSGCCSEGRESSSGADQTEELSAIQGHEKSPMMLLIVTDNYCQLIGGTRKIY